MADTTSGKGPSGRGGTGFSFDDGKPGGRRGDRDGDRRGRGGKDGGGAGYRVVTEVSRLEKALTKADFAGQKGALDDLLKALRASRATSLEKLDLGTRGKLLTSLLRVVRQPKPKVAEAASPAEAPAAEPAPASDATPPATEGTGDAPSTETVAAPASAEAAAPASKPAPSHSDAVFAVGMVWRLLGDGDRASAAFEVAGRQPSAAEVAALTAAQPEPEPAARSERGPRGAKGGRGDRNDKGRRAERPARPTRAPSVAFQGTGPWVPEARRLEEMGRTRDAGRLHEQHKSHEWALRLFEIGGDLKAALRNAALGGLDEKFTELSAKMKPADVAFVLERAQSWEKLMAFQVARGDFEAVAKLYERAKQFDQAGLAWERAKKLSFARKAYERAKDLTSVARVRELEIASLIERGDRLGAATVLMSAGKKAEALEILKPLPAPKVFHFMQKLKLDEEAKVLASEHLQKAIDANDVAQRAKWQELLGDLPTAAASWLEAGRKDKASFVLEQLEQFPQAAEYAEAAGQLDRAQRLFTRAGDVANATRVAALPRPEKVKGPAAVAADAPPPGSTETSGTPPEASA